VRRFTITRVTTVTALCGVAGAILLAPFTAIAQENAGGLLMKLRLGERFVQRETESPDVAFDGTTTQLITDLDLSLRSETRTQMVELTFGTGYRFFEGPTTDGLEQNFVDPTLRLTYKQVAARSSLQTSLTAMQVDLADVSPFTLSDAPDGGLVRDFSQLTDGGTRTALSFGGTASMPVPASRSPTAVSTCALAALTAMAVCKTRWGCRGPMSCPAPPRALALACRRRCHCAMTSAMHGKRPQACARPTATHPTSPRRQEQPCPSASPAALRHGPKGDVLVSDLRTKWAFAAFARMAAL